MEPDEQHFPTKVGFFDNEAFPQDFGNPSTSSKLGTDPVHDHRGDNDV